MLRLIIIDITTEGPASQKELPEVTSKSATPPEERRSTEKRLITRGDYEELMRLADDGCPLVIDLDDFQLVETETQTGG